MKVELGRGDRIFWIVLFAVVAAHLLAYVMLAYPAMPQTVPTHWGADGAVDGWGDKAGTIFMAAMPFLVALIMLAVPQLRAFPRHLPGHERHAHPVHGRHRVDDAAHRLRPRV